jgi:hypothetical protein
MGMFRVFRAKGRRIFSAVQTAWRRERDSNLGTGSSVTLMLDVSLTYRDFILESSAAETRHMRGQTLYWSGFCGRSKGEGLAIIGHKGAVVEPLRL